MGTPSYMAPEQFRNARHAGPEADVYALGAILYEMVTGRRAYDGDDLIALFDAMRGERYADPRRLAPEAPQRWMYAITQSLIGDRSRRVQTVQRLRGLWDGVDGPTPVGATWVEQPAAEPPTATGRTATPRTATPISTPSLAPMARDSIGAVGWFGGVLSLGMVGVLSLCAAFGLVAWWAWTAAQDPTQPALDAPPVRELVEPVAPKPAPRRTAPEPVALSASPTQVPPEPPPTVEPPTPRGTLTVDSKVPVGLRNRAGVSVAPGEVDAGEWTVMADFGDGLLPTITVSVAPGMTLRVSCNRLKRTCSID